MRYFAKLAYKGTNYHGWQKQPHSTSVQAVIEEAFSTILGTEIELVGCGRTDTGVHASQYFAHFDFAGDFPEGFLNRTNKYLPKDIAVRQITSVPETAHARFDATRRSYEYHLVFEKMPFETDTTWYYYLGKNLDVGRLNEAASLLLNYQEFAPFCKSNHQSKTLECDLHRCEWVLDEKSKRLVFHITANRFLRGMVRLIVGMCVNVAVGKLDLAEVKSAMEEQRPLAKSWSVPGHGLFLSEVQYPTFPEKPPLGVGG